jgi:hypothetical protein
MVLAVKRIVISSSDKCLLRLHVRRRAIAFLVVDLVDLLEQRGDAVEALERLVLQFFEFLGQCLGAALAVIVVGFIELVEVFLGHVVVSLVDVGEAVHHGRDDDLAFADLAGHPEDFRNGGGRGADRLHHGHQAAFDALGDLDLAFPRQQLHRAHLAHVHAHRVGGAAEFAVHRAQRGFCGFLGFFFGGAGGRAVGQDEGFRIRRLFVHRHTQVVQGGDDGFHGFRVDELVGQMVGDLAVRQVAARLAQLDQGLQALAALGHVFLGQDGLVQAEFLHQRAFLGLADLHAQGLDLFGRLGHRFTDQVGLDIAHVQIVGRYAGGSHLGLASALGAGGRRLGGLGRTARLFLDGLDGFGSRGGGLLGFLDRGFCGGLDGGLGGWLGGGCSLGWRLRCGHGSGFRFGLGGWRRLHGLGRGRGRSGRAGLRGRFCGLFRDGCGRDGLLGLLSGHGTTSGHQNGQVNDRRRKLPARVTELRPIRA